MPTSTVTASPETARRAGQAFWFRKWRTKSGAFALGSIACVIGTVVWLSIIFGGMHKAPIGFPAALLVMWLAMEAGSLIGMPLGLARAARAPANASEVQVDDDGVTIKSGRNVRFLPWTTLSAIWIYDDFIILPVGPFVVSRFVWVPRAGMSAEVFAAFQRASVRPSKGTALKSVSVR